MTKEQYKEIRNDQSKDTLPVLYFFYQLRKSKGKVLLSPYQFSYAFGHWLLAGAFALLPSIQYKVFTELDKHFKLNVA